MPEKIKLQLPSGQVAEIEVPDGASQQQIQFAVKTFRSKNPQLFGAAPQQQESLGPEIDVDQELHKAVANRNLPLVKFIQQHGRLPTEQESQESMTSALPVVGGAAGALIGSPAGGAPGAIGGAALGGAAGESARQLINRSMGLTAPQTSGEAAKNIAIEGAIQGAFEAVGRGLSAGVTTLVGKFINRPSAAEAQRLIANEIADTSLSPAQTGKVLQESFDAVKDAAGKRVGQSLEAAARKGATIEAFSPSADNTLKVVGEELETLAATSKVSKEFGAKSAVIERELSRLQSKLPRVVNGELVVPNPTPRPAPPTNVANPNHPYFTHKEFLPIEKAEALKVIQQAKQDFGAAVGETVTRESRRISGRINDAAKQDISRSLKDAGLNAELLDYTAANARFGEVAALGKKDLLKRIFGNQNVRRSPGKILALIRSDEEAAIEAIKTLNKEGQKVPLRDIQRAIFDDLSQSGQLVGGGKDLPKIGDAVLKEVFGAQKGRQVAQFRDLLIESSRQTVFNKMVGWLSTRGPAGTRFGFVDPTGNLVSISPRKLRALLEKPGALDLLMKGMQEPLDKTGEIASKTGINIARGIQLMLRSIDGEESTKDKDE